MKPPTRLLPLLLALLLPLPAVAESHALALVVGSDLGNPGRRPLRYAERDARKVAAVLEELGGVPADDLLLLAGRPAEEVERALERLRVRTAELHRRSGDTVAVTFFFSGHADGEALELGATRLPWSALRKGLAETGAEVRLAIVDACQSGSVLRSKGGKAAPAFEVKLDEEESQRGAVFLTSAAASESALESSEVQGSFFTHHLVSALRGAADADGDGRVTLNEAYRHAYDRTVEASARTLSGTQHPSFSTDLVGRGELVLTRLAEPDLAQLQLPAEGERWLLVDEGASRVVAESSGVGPRAFALRPGRYAVEGAVGERGLVAHVELKRREHRALRLSDFQAGTLALASRKGGPLEVERRDEPATDARDGAASLGLLASLGGGLGLPGSHPALGLRLGVENIHASGFGVGLDLAQSPPAPEREGRALLRTGLRLGGDFGPVRLITALETGLGLGWSVAPDRASRFGPLATIAPRLGLRLQAARSLWITAEGEVAALGGWVGVWTGRLLPSAQLGIELGL